MEDPSASHDLNFAVSDGITTVVSRYAAGARAPASLYYSAGSRYVFEGDDGDMVDADGPRTGAVIVASEPLTRRPEDWKTVPENHTLTIDAGLSTRLDRIAL